MTMAEIRKPTDWLCMTDIETGSVRVSTYCCSVYISIATYEYIIYFRILSEITKGVSALQEKNWQASF